MLRAFCCKSRTSAFCRSTRLCAGESLNRWFSLGSWETVVSKSCCVKDRFVLLLFFLTFQVNDGTRAHDSSWPVQRCHQFCTTRWFYGQGSSCQRRSWWSAWFTAVFTDMFQMLVIVSRFWVSRRIGGLLRFGIFIEVTHHSWLPSVTSGEGERGWGEQMVRGLHGMRGRWNTRVSWCFLCFSAHLVYILFKDYYFLLCLPGCRTRIGVQKTSARILKPSSPLRESRNSSEPLQNR